MGIAPYVQKRSPRFRSYPERFSSYVRYAESRGDSVGRSAQFADVSLSGMQVISRHPTTAQVGDFVTLEFTLPGSSRTVRNLAQVVRKKSEFVFAVKFLNSSGRLDLQNSIEDYVAFVRRTFTFGPVLKTVRWISDHRQGLLASLVGALVLGSAGLWIYLGSDEYHGRGLRSWGQDMPKEWFTGYYGKSLPGSKFK